MQSGYILSGCVRFGSVRSDLVPYHYVSPVVPSFLNTVASLSVRFSPDGSPVPEKSPPLLPLPSHISGHSKQ